MRELAQTYGRTLTGEETERLTGDTAGNPFFLTQLLGSARSQPLAVSVHDVLEEKLSRLSPSSREILEVLSLANTPLDRALVHRWNLDSEGELGAVELITLAKYRDRDALAPAHDRIGVFITSRLLPARARSLHAALAVRLVVHDAPPAALLAYHWAAADDTVKAGTRSEVAGDEAYAQLAWATSAEHFTRALELRGDAPRASLLRRLASSLANSGLVGPAADAWVQAAEIDGDPVDRLLAAEHVLATGAISEGLRVLAPVARAAGIYLPRSPISGAVTAAFWRLRIHARGLHWLERREDEVPDAQRRRADVCWTLGSALGMADTLTSFALQSRHVYEGLESGVPERVARALGTEIVYVGALGRPSRYLTGLFNALAEVESQLTDDAARALLSLCRGYSSFLLGQLIRADACFREARDRYGRLKLHRWEADILTRGSLWVDRQRGRYAAFRAALLPAIEAAHDTGDWLTWMQMTLLSAEEALVRHQMGEAEDLIRRAREAPVAEVPWGTDFIDEHARLHLEVYDRRWTQAAARLHRLKRKWAPVRKFLHVRAELWWFEAVIAMAMKRASATRTATTCMRHLMAETEPWPRALGLSLAAALTGRRGRTTATAYQHAALRLEEAGFHGHAVAARLHGASAEGDDDGAQRSWQELLGAGVVDVARYAESTVPTPFDPIA